MHADNVTGAPASPSATGPSRIIVSAPAAGLRGIVTRVLVGFATVALVGGLAHATCHAQPAGRGGATAGNGTASGGGAPAASGTTTSTGAGAGATTAAATGSAAGEVRFAAGLESPYVLRGSSGPAHLVIDLAAASPATVTVRPSMAVALVIDRSGSMAGEKIARAIAAASSFIQGTADGDVVAIYQYDGDVEQLAPPTVIGPATRQGLLAAVATIRPRGSTNLYGGLATGIAAMSSPGAERPVRRVIVISDGLANVGPSSPDALGGTAAAAAMRGISVTAIGVGLDYDEAVLAALAMRSGGRFYHLRELAQMEAILQSELAALGQTVARRVWIDVAPGPGVQVVGATGADLIRRGRGARLQVGDMTGGQSRPVVVALQVPTSGRADRTAAQVALHYQAAASDTARSRTATVAYQLAANQAQVDGAMNPDFALVVERHRSAAAAQEAARLVGSGRAAAAGDVLARRAAHMRRRARSLGGRAGASLSADAARVEREERSTRRVRSPRARRARQLELTDDALGGLGF